MFEQSKFSQKIKNLGAKSNSLLWGIIKVMMSIKAMLKFEFIPVTVSSNGSMDLPKLLASSCFPKWNPVFTLRL